MRTASVRMGKKSPKTAASVSEKRGPAARVFALAPKAYFFRRAANLSRNFFTLGATTKAQ